jgi:pilus assembly protein CpaF
MDMTLTKEFEINEYLNQNAIQNKPQIQSSRNQMPFDVVWNKVKKHFELVYDSNKITNQEKEKRLKIEYEAMVGTTASEKYLIDEIEAYLREQHLLNSNFPSFYNTLAEGCFHEIYGFGNFAKWSNFPSSTDGIIQGKEIWFNIKGVFVRQEEELRDEDQVWEIIRTLQMRVKGLRINENNPEAEFDRDDGTRIKVIVPPRSYKPTIIFRRFIIEKFSFKEQADRRSIPKEDIPLYDWMAKLHLNTIISGKVQSGKSTFLKTIYSARDPKSVAVLIETSPESYLKRDFPDRLVYDFYTSDGSVDQVIRDALRTPHDYIIAQEVRGVEAEGAIAGTERGTRGLLMTYHITNPKNTPRQLAKHITDQFPSRKEKNEIQRIAEQLDIGITMTSIKNNEKRVTSVFEFCYDDETEVAWINYLIKYDPIKDQWEYNPDISLPLIERMNEYDSDVTDQFIKLLKQRSIISPLKSKAIYPCK